ncbi:hypothetical protein [Clostridium butyricum]|uniref:hypothetical protein n=1 Tax=Clostridium butyricum TaxID=1492 RepID=UPI000903B2AC|nr:hypothetical protein [Clostridium butyricum]APF22550.1 hypothetical protein NPD4_1997 [Clostridium butyricum]
MKKIKCVKKIIMLIILLLALLSLVLIIPIIINLIYSNIKIHSKNNFNIINVQKSELVKNRFLYFIGEKV